LRVVEGEEDKGIQSYVVGDEINRVVGGGRSGKSVCPGRKDGKAKKLVLPKSLVPKRGLKKEGATTSSKT